MSTRPTPAAPVGTSARTVGEASVRRPVTILDLAAMKQAGTKIVMVTAYDFASALAAEAAGVDVVLVGDSGAMTVLGYPSTVGVTVEEMLVLARATRRGTRTGLLVADLPFGSYEGSDAQAVATAVRFVKEAGVDAVKLERGDPQSAARVRAIVAAGIPVMGHVGLTPQSATALGGYRVQGRTAESAVRVVEGLLALQDAGCFSIVVEAVPDAVTAQVMQTTTVPIIGIGAGPSTDGQVLVFHDLLGIRHGKGAKFVKRYADLLDAMTHGITSYSREVRDGTFPATQHAYIMEPDELKRFNDLRGV